MSAASRHFLFLFFPEARTLCLSDRHSPVTGDRDPLCPACAVIIVKAVHHIAVDLQLRFRCLKEVLKKTSAIFLKTPAASITAVSRLCALHEDRIFTAAFFRVVNTCCHCTVQFCHNMTSFSFQRSLCTKRSRIIHHGTFFWHICTTQSLFSACFTPLPPDISVSSGVPSACCCPS